MIFHLPLSLRTPWQSVSHDHISLHQEEEEEKVCGDSLNLAFCTDLNSIMAPAKLKLQQTLLANFIKGGPSTTDTEGRDMNPKQFGLPGLTFSASAWRSQRLRSFLDRPVRAVPLSSSIPEVVCSDPPVERKNRLMRSKVQLVQRNSKDYGSGMNNRIHHRKKEPLKCRLTINKHSLKDLINKV